MNKKYSPESRSRKIWIGWIFVALLGALLLNSLAGDFFKRTFFNLITALTPLIIGVIIAFVLKKMVDFLENKVFKKWFSKLKNGQKVNRVFSISLLFVLLFLVVWLCVMFIIPEIVDFVEFLNKDLNNTVENIKRQLTEFFTSTGWFNQVDIEKMIADFIDQLGNSLTQNIPLLAQSVANLLQQTAVVLGYLIVGIIIAFMILYKKEKISDFSKRLTYASFSTNKANNIIKTARVADKILYDYITTKCIEAVIVFTIMLPGMYIFKIPYPIVMALLMAILNIIPYIGSVFAGIIIAIFTIAYSTINNAIWVILYMFITLNLYGNLIGPFLYGKKMKISALLIIISLLVFGSIFGFWGLIIGPPLMAIIWIIINEFINNKENEKLELQKHNLTDDDINDLEVLEEAAKIVRERRLKNETKKNTNNEKTVDEIKDNLSVENFENKKEDDNNFEDKKINNKNIKELNKKVDSEEKTDNNKKINKSKTNKSNKK